MPIYDFLCPLCGEVNNVWGHINEDRKMHDECGRTMIRQISRCNVNPDYEPWLDDNLSGQDGTPIAVRSRRHHKQLLKERGLSIR